MFCKWCGNTVASGETTCRRCKKPLPAQSDCGGIAELLAAIKPAAGLGAAAAGGSVGGASADASSLKAARSEVAAAKAEADQAKKKAKTMGLLVIILAAALVVALLVMSIWVANLSGKVHDLQDNGPSVSDSLPVTQPSEEPVVSEEPEITLLYINMLPQVVHVGDALPADDDYQFILTDEDGNEVDISTIPGLEITPVCGAATDAPGTYTITATFTEVEGYEFRVLDNELVVLDESLTPIYIDIIVTPSSITQGGEMPEITYNLTYENGTPYEESFLPDPNIEPVHSINVNVPDTYTIDAKVTNEGDLTGFKFVVKTKGTLTVKEKAPTPTPKPTATPTPDPTPTPTQSHTKHTWGKWKVTKEADCTTSGERVHTCTYTGCGKTEAETIPATRHSYGTDDSCTVCGTRNYDHTHSGGTATCTAKAVCSTCGEAYGDLNPDNHSYQETVTKPTCTEAGYTTYTCSGCNNTKTETGESATGHTGGTATCKKKATCTNCTKEYGEVNPNNHTGGTATCKRPAVCDDCEQPYGSVDPNNHTGGTATCKEKATCTNCTEEYGELNPDNHTGTPTDNGCTDCDPQPNTDDGTP